MEPLSWFSWLLILACCGLLLFVGYAAGLQSGSGETTKLHSHYGEKIDLFEKRWLADSARVEQLEEALEDLRFALEAGKYTSDDQLIAVIDKALDHG